MEPVGYSLVNGESLPLGVSAATLVCEVGVGPEGRVQLLLFFALIPEELVLRSPDSQPAPHTLSRRARAPQHCAVSLGWASCTGIGNGRKPGPRKDYERECSAGC